MIKYLKISDLVTDHNSVVLKMTNTKNSLESSKALKSLFSAVQIQCSHNFCVLSLLSVSNFDTFVFFFSISPLVVQLQSGTHMCLSVRFFPICRRCSTL